MPDISGNQNYEVEAHVKQIPGYIELKKSDWNCCGIYSLVVYMGVEHGIRREKLKYEL